MLIIILAPEIVQHYGVQRNSRLVMLWYCENKAQTQKQHYIEYRERGIKFIYPLASHYIYMGEIGKFCMYQLIVKLG